MPFSKFIKRLGIWRISATMRSAPEKSLSAVRGVGMIQHIPAPFAAQASFRVLDGQAFIGPAAAPLYRDSIGFRIGFGTPVISLPHHEIKVGQKTRSPVDDFEVFFLGACNNPHAKPPG
jgi:hypothetical protein